MDAVDACYHFAGVTGFDPHRFSLRQLWKMATGKIKQRRFEMVEFANVIWGLEQLDVERFLLFGEIESTGKGGEAMLPPELQEKVNNGQS